MLKPLTSETERALRDALQPDAFREAEPRYFEEPRGRYQGQAGMVLAPASTADVQKAVQIAHSHATAIIPYGGGTGLVGGQVADGIDAPIVLSLERMTELRAVYPEENVLIAEAGVILATIQEAAAQVSRLFPLSLASEGSARIGGVLATNAGGVNVLRYGNGRDLCLGLEVVLADGTVWNGLSRLRKDNAGFDLRNLMIGSEGTLGIITAAALKLAPIPASEGTAFFQVASPDAALALLALARAHVGEGLSAFELIHRQSFDFLTEKLPDLRHPFAETPDWAVLMELGLPRGLAPQRAFEDMYAEASAAALSSDAVIAQSEQQRAEFWALRESIPEANRRIGSVSSHDISLPLGALPDFIRAAGPALAAIGDFRVNCFGHVGDGNLHYNVFPQPGRSRADHENERPEIKRVVHDLVHGFGGSVAAEHGVGRLKVEDLERYGDPALLSMMRSVKSALDPKGILNPGVMLR